MSALEVLMVLDLSGAGDGQRCFEVNKSSAGGYMRVIVNATTGNIQAIVTDGSDKIGQVNTSPSGLHLVGGRFASGSHVVAYIDGTEGSTAVGTTVASSTDGGRLMASRINTSYTTGIVKALFVIDRELTSTERATMLAWAQSQFGTP